MSPDPVLLRLVDEAERAAAAVRAYVAGEPAELHSDLVSLKDGQREFSRSIDTLRRWAGEEGLGELVDGRWYLRRSLVRQYKRA